MSQALCRSFLWNYWLDSKKISDRSGEGVRWVCARTRWGAFIASVHVRTTGEMGEKGGKTFANLVRTH